MVREAAILNSFRAKRHDNILYLRDSFFRHDRVYLVFDHYHCNLRNYVTEISESGKISMCTAQLQSFMRQLLSALAFCHERSVIHRDIKPDNILLDETKQRLVVCDFGMARLYCPRDCLTENCVTSWYRPPEMLLGDKMYGPEVDIWSAGMIMAEMINLSPVLSRAETDLQCLLFIFEWLGTPSERTWPGVSALPNFQHRMLKCSYRPPSSLLIADNVSPFAADLLNQMLQLCPSRRLAAADALATHSFFAASFSANPSMEDRRPAACTLPQGFGDQVSTGERADDGERPPYSETLGAGCLDERSPACAKRQRTASERRSSLLKAGP